MRPLLSSPRGFSLYWPAKDTITGDGDTLNVRMSSDKSKQPCRGFSTSRMVSRAPRMPTLTRVLVHTLHNAINNRRKSQEKITGA